MKIGIHSNQFDDRGTGKAPLDYANALKEYFNYECVFISSKQGNNKAIPNIISQGYKVIQYDESANNIPERYIVKSKLQKIVDQEKLNFLYQVKWGTNDLIVPDNCKTGIHCVFEMTEPHGQVYAGVSEYIAQKYNQPLFVPHIITRYPSLRYLRNELNIPAEATVIGRHGGFSNFSIPFAQQAVRDILTHRNDIYFLFLSTDKFIDHPRVIFLPWAKNETEKFDFIESCDAMLHARLEGETFGLAVAEFSIAHRPIITWSGVNHPGYDKAHLHQLGKKALKYDNYEQLLDILYSINQKDIHHHHWNCYEDFTDEKVINKFNSVFLL